MNLSDIHFIREILVSDYKGKLVPTMQSSDSNESTRNPHFTSASFYEAAELRALYHELGGSRLPEEHIGSTVIIPHRTRWESLWKVTQADVKIVGGVGGTRDTAAEGAARKSRARSRDRQMRD